MNTIAVSEKGNKVFVEIIKDLETAIPNMSLNDWKDILLHATFESFNETLTHKEEIGQNIWEGVRSIYDNKEKIVSDLCDSTMALIDKYYAKGFTNALSEDFETVKQYAENSKDDAMKKLEGFYNLSREEKIEILAIVVLTLLVFFASAGGLDLEGGMPDLDITFLGIGGHRNIFFHSIIIGLGFEFLLRFVTHLINACYKHLPESHNKTWDVINNIITKSEKYSVMALWVGVGAHLLKDAKVFDGRIKPYAGLPGSHPMGFHKVLLASNAFASAIFSWHKQ
ncbi:MAG: hypothetical protein HY811_12410 [Planctomycetes bacterium]|nr:hypothetical protein [Planctomycetota bacterium]